MNHSTQTTAILPGIPTPRYGLHVAQNINPKPRVHRLAGGGYRIYPIPVGTPARIDSDDLESIVTDTMPMGLQVVRFFALLLPPIGLPLWLLTDRHYERKFWISNGFDPDSFSS